MKKSETETETDRLEQIITHFCKSKAEFARQIGEKPQTVSNWVARGLSKNIIDKIIERYPEVNINWLISGVGSMIKKQEAKAIEDFEFVLIPHVPITARAGYMAGFGDDEFIESLPTVPVIVDKQYNGKYRVFDVDGDSMYDGSINSICDKDKILCREVKNHLWQYKLHINDWFFVIVHKEEGVIVKQIIDHNIDTGEITCHSLNPLFQDFTLNLNDVVELYNVIKIVDRNTRI